MPGCANPGLGKILEVRSILRQKGSLAGRFELRQLEQPTADLRIPAGEVPVRAIDASKACRARQCEEIGRPRLAVRAAELETARQRTPFWRQYVSNFEEFSKTEFAQPGIDAEVVSS